jgi:hypothetical protein
MRGKVKVVQPLITGLISAALLLVSFALAAREAKIDAAAIYGSAFFTGISHKGSGIGIGLFYFFCCCFSHVLTPINSTKN